MRELQKDFFPVIPKIMSVKKAKAKAKVKKQKQKQKQKD